MRRTPHTPTPAGQKPFELHVGQTLRMLFPYLWEFKWRVILAMVSLVAA